MRNSKIFRTLMALAVVGALAACSSADADEGASEEVACEDVQSELSAADDALEEAESRLEEVDGGPDESEAEDDVDEAQARVEELSERSLECDTGTTSTTTTECTTWALQEADNSGNRVFANGVPSIGAATTPEEATAAAHTWLSMVRTDPDLFAGTAQYLLDEDVDPGSLFDAEGCATQEAEVLLGEMETALALSIITPSEAPANGTNSGVDPATGEMVGAENSGISGDRKAILIELPDGTKVWVMARCGNPVVIGPPPLPPGPTDNPPPPPPPPPTTTTTKPPTTEDCQQNGTGPNCPFPPVQQPPQDNDTSGVDTGPTPGAPVSEPPPAERPSGDPNGGSGDGGAPPPTGPTDDSDADEVTEAPPPGEDPCPFGPGNC
jgi:hypothetical protein